MIETDCIPSSLDIFSLPPKEVGIDDITIAKYLPLSGATNAGTLEFYIPGDSSQYIDLNYLRLYIQVEVKRQDGKDIGDSSSIELVPLFPHAMFRQVDVILGHKTITSSTNTYPYRAFMEKALSYSRTVKDEVLEATEHWKGFTVNKAKSKTEAFIPLHVELTQQSKMLINGVDMKIKLLRSNDDFVIKKQSDDGVQYTVNISNISLYVRKVTPTAAVLLNHAQRLSAENARYPIDRVWIKTFNLVKGSQDTVLSNIFLGTLPPRVIIGLIDSDAFNGTKNTDPFKFEHFDVNHVSLLSDSKCIPAIPLEPNFSDDLIRREYFHLLHTLQSNCYQKEDIGISLEDFKSKGYTFYAFTLPNVLEGSGPALSPKQSGFINLRLGFKKPLPKNVTVIVYGEFQDEIIIDSSRAVYTTYN